MSTVSQPDLSLDFVGIAGCHTFGSPLPDQINIISNRKMVNKYDAEIDQIRSLVSCTIQQLSVRMSSDQIVSNPSVNQNCSGECLATWSGAIWHLRSSSMATLTNFRQCQIMLCNAAKSEEHIELVSEIVGDFVASILTRDHIVLLSCAEATQQLYYKFIGKTLIWSSNISHLMDSVDDIDHESLACISWGASVSPYRNIGVINPGQYKFFRESGTTGGCFNDKSLILSMPKSRPSLIEYSELARQLLMQSVADRVRPYKRIGLLLSGGIDSSAIARCLYDLGVDVRCYHISFAAFPPADETEYAEEVARYLTLPFRVIEVDIAGGKHNMMIDLDWTFDVPYNHPTYAMWQHAISAAKEDGCDCIMSGKLGDVYFGGERTTSVLKDALSVGLRDGLHTLYHGLATEPWGVSEWINRRIRKNSPDAISTYPNVPSPLRQIFHYTLPAKKAVLQLDRRFVGVSLATLSLNLHALQSHGMAFAAPFASAEIRAFSQIIPSAYRSVPYGGAYYEKPILRRAFVGLLPPRIIARNYRNFMDGIAQQYCLTNDRLLLALLSSNSYLAKLEIIDPVKLQKLHSDRPKWMACANTLIINAMTELWLQTMFATRLVNDKT